MHSVQEMTTVQPVVATASNHPAYRPDIDGLRAFAVLVVVFFHAFPDYITGGFVGVDVFFVISGYLISAILFKSFDRQQFSFLDFYARRARRIIPALLVILVACLGMGWALMLPDEFSQLGSHITAGSFFYSNFQLWSEVGYFDERSELKPLLHLWSLGIEEQFYLLWPILVALGYRFRQQTALLIVLAVASFLLCLSSLHDAAGRFYLPHNRFWELLAGSMLALASLRGSLGFFARYRGLAQIQSTIGCLLLFGTVIVFTRHTPFPGWFAVLPVLGACLVIAAGEGAWFNKYILASRLMVFIGLISFPLYLWHWPLLSFARLVEGEVPATAIRVVLVLISGVLAWLTYEFVEKSMRHRGNMTAMVLMLCLLLVGAIGQFCKAQKLPLFSDRFHLEHIVEAADSFEYPGTELELFIHEGVEFRKQGNGDHVTMFMGDSNMEQYWPRVDQWLDENRDANRQVLFATRGGCLPIRHVRAENEEYCAALVEKAYALALSDPRIDRVVIAAQWFSYFLGPGRVFVDNGEMLPLRDFNSPGVLKAYESLDHMLRDFKAAGKQVYLVQNIPVGAVFDPKNLVSRSISQFGFSLRKQGISREEHESTMGKFSGRLAEIANRNGAVLLDPAALICGPVSCDSVTSGGWPIYKDQEHWNSVFVRQHALFLDQTLEGH